MQLKVHFQARSPKVQQIEWLLHEIYLSWLFVKGDISATLVPTFFFTVAAWSNHSGLLSDLVVALGSGLLYFWLYVFTFCLSNQLMGIDEDRINKPYRPLVCRLVSYRGALVRWVVSMIIFTMAGWWLGVLAWTLLWQVAIILHNFCGLAKHWFGKHLLMAVGVICGLAPAWELVAPLTPDAARWILCLACIILPLIATQDLRDTAGDRAIGRRTVPIVFGELPTRIMLCCCFTLLPLVVYFSLMVNVQHVWGALLSTIVLSILSLKIAVRVILFRSRQADQRTYMFFTYWYCCITASAVVVL
jgi:4-hydroxybenzoate polyprenyltransferase